MRLFTGLFFGLYFSTVSALLLRTRFIKAAFMNTADSLEVNHEHQCVVLTAFACELLPRSVIFLYFPLSKLILRVA